MRRGRGATGGGTAARPSVERRIRELVERYGLPPTADRSLAALLVLLEADPLAPTTVTDAAAAVDEHIADALVALQLPAVSGAASVADLGAGAGFPGLPLAIALPHAAVSLVESNGRKCEFLRRALAASGVANAVVIHARAEAWPAGTGRFDVVTARALAAPAVVAEYAAPLMRIGGRLVIWRGRRDAAAERSAEAAADVLGLEVESLKPVHPFDWAEHRYLYVMSKVRDTPARFPRRPGVATKRPLGAAES